METPINYKDYWISLFGVTLCFYTHSGRTWNVTGKPFEMPDPVVGCYTIWFVINTPVMNFCVSNYLQKIKTSG